MERARPALPADGPRLTALDEAALQEIAGRRGGAALAADILGGRRIADLVSGAIEDPDALVAAGEYHGVVLGVAVARAEPAGGSAARVEVLYVDPEVRAVGIGEALLGAVEAWASARGCSGMDAVALPGHREAKSFFETHGMVARALVMHRDLPGGAR